MDMCRYECRFLQSLVQSIRTHGAGAMCGFKLTDRVLESKFGSFMGTTCTLYC